MKRRIAVTAGLFIWQCLVIGVVSAQTGTACPSAEKFVDGVNKVITNDRAGRIYTTGEYGIFRSCDSGETWHKSDTVRRVPGALAIDNGNPRFVYYTSWNYVYRSENYGESFVQVGAGQIEGTGISTLRVRQDGTILAGTSAGAYLSPDRGSNWQKMPGTDWGVLITDFHTDAGNANVLHVGTHGQGIFSTTDGGQTWMQSDPTFSGWHIVELEVDPQNPATLFAVGNNNLWRSVDAGTSWVAVVSNSASDLAFDPDEPNRAYLLTYTDGIFSSGDGGSTWELVNPLSATSLPMFISIDVLPGGRLLAGTQHEGIFASDDGARTWQLASGSAPPTQPAPVAPGPFADLSLEATVLNEDGSVSAGNDAVIRLTLRNNGPDAATNVFLDFSWFHQRIVGGKDYFTYSAKTSSGSCSNLGAHYCLIPGIPSGASATVEFRGKTNPGELRYYSLLITYGSDVSSTKTLETGVGAAVTVLSTGGGGALGAAFLAMLLAFLVGSTLYRNASRDALLRVRSTAGLQVEGAGQQLVDGERAGVATRP